MTCVLTYGDLRPDVSVCVPSYDASRMRIAKLVESVEATTTEFAWEVVVVDCERELRGYTRPQNEAMARGRGHYLVACNDDVEFVPGWTRLLEPLATGSWCATPDATHTDGPQVFAPWCMAWRTSSWRMAGGLDERFFFWGSDIDLARRMVDSGQRPVRVLLDPPLRHELNGTARNHPELGPRCVADLEAFRAKWQTDAESEKHRLAALVTV